ncbi:MAG: hypothetical protein V4732_22795 [Pseudomonadota bacterium]
MTATRHNLIKALIVITLLFQAINIAWASNHNCCPEDNPDCVMVSMTIGCSACLALAIPAKASSIVEVLGIAIKVSVSSLDYLSVNNHVIWRPPIVFILL